MREGVQQSRLDGVALLTTLSLLVLLLVACQKRSKEISSVEACYANLKQLGGAFATFSLEHSRMLPMTISTNNWGTLEHIANPDFVYAHFRALSNWLSSPFLLKCPSDSRVAQMNWQELANSNVSYFVGLDAMISDGRTILGGDRHVKGYSNAIISIDATTSLSWDALQSEHKDTGNILFGDGSVQSAVSGDLQGLFQVVPKRPYRIAVP